MKAALAGCALLALAACENASPDVSPKPLMPTLAVAQAATPEPLQKSARPANPSIEFAGELTQGGWIKGTVPQGTASAALGDAALDFDAEGRFFAAFDRDAPSSATLAVTLEDGHVTERQITIAPRAWNIEHVNVAKRSGGSSEAWWKKREPEWLAIKAAREKETGASGWQQDFIWPVKGRISGRLGSQRIYRGEPGSYHSGLDIAPGAGKPFVAPADGVVVLAVQNFSLEGNLLIIDHGQGLNSAFLHASRLMVSEGDEVTQGQHIGNVGSSGRATGPHLHWSLKWHDARLDPLLFVPPQ